MKKVLRVLGLSLALLLVLVGCGSTEETDDVVKIGVIGSDSVVWNHVAEKAAEEDIEIQIVYFDSYPLPNAALDAREIDLNAFQHHIYLDTEV